MNLFKVFLFIKDTGVRRWFFSLVVLFLFLTFLPPVQSLYPGSSVRAQSGEKCNICKKAISGQYWKSGSSTICDQCYRTYPRCQRCGLPGKKLQSIDGKSICASCVPLLPSCQKCRKPMFDYFQHPGSDGKSVNLCRRCSEAALGACQLCGSSLLGKKYYEMTSSTTGRTCRYCISCKTKGEKCYTCGLLAPPSKENLVSKRYACDFCKVTAIRTDEEYRQLFIEIGGIFRKRLGLHHKMRHKYQVVDLKTLRELKKKHLKTSTSEGDTMGLFVSSEVTSVDITGRKKTTARPGVVYILDYLPRDIAYWVIAHEYAHAWYRERVLKDKGLLLEEGFAEWVAYHILLEKELNVMAHCLAQHENVYGQGARRLIELEKKKGIKEVLRYVTQ